jgi:hypothetical protein
MTIKFITVLDDEDRDCPRNVGVLAIQPPDRPTRLAAEKLLGFHIGTRTSILLSVWGGGLKLFERCSREFHFISFHSSNLHLQNRLMVVVVVVLLDITL